MTTDFFLILLLTSSMAFLQETDSNRNDVFDEVYKAVKDNAMQPVMTDRETRALISFLCRSEAKG